MSRIQHFLIALTTALLSSPGLASEASPASEPSCLAAGVVDADCRDPIEGEWQSWRFVLGETPGLERESEAEAIADAVAVLERTFFCGLSYSMENSAYVSSKKLWSWTTREEAIRFHYIGLIDESRQACTGQLVERRGTVVIRRERKVKCPRDYNWLVRDEQHAVCVRE